LTGSLKESLHKAGLVGLLATEKTEKWHKRPASLWHAGIEGTLQHPPFAKCATGHAPRAGVTTVLPSQGTTSGGQAKGAAQLSFESRIKFTGAARHAVNRVELSK